LLFRTGKQFIGKGDRIVLLGSNGSGKTRLVTMLRAGIETPDAAQAGIKATQSLVLGYCDQALAGLDDAETPMRAIVRRFEVGDQRARTLLAGAGLAIEKQGRPIIQLSGGQKARLGMLVLRLTQPNFYLLDEPTNHLDIESVEGLEEALESYEGTILLVSHDRAMLEALTSRVWVLHEQHVTDFPGSFGEWEEQSREREHAAAVAASEQEALRRVRERQTTRRREVKGDESKAVLREARQKVEKCEKEVAVLERKVGELTALLEDPELYTTREGMERSRMSGKELDAARRQLDAAIERWTGATERAEQLAAT
jgi:ABC-type multidrug transport system ATPase subunit